VWAEQKFLQGKPKTCFLSLTESGDLLHKDRFAEADNGWKLVVFSKHRKKLIFQYFHNGNGGNHLRCPDTVKAITAHFYWAGIVADIEKAFLQCCVCKVRFHVC